MFCRFLNLPKSGALTLPMKLLSLQWIWGWQKQIKIKNLSQKKNLILDTSPEKRHTFAAMFATSSEIAQYIRMTLKQWGVSHLKIEWMERKKYLGLACVTENKIKLNKRILASFEIFDEVLKHEIAHCIQWKRNGNRFLTKNGRHIFHGADFAAVCKEMGIPARTRIPIRYKTYA